MSGTELEEGEGDAEGGDALDPTFAVFTGFCSDETDGNIGAGDEHEGEARR